MLAEGEIENGETIHVVVPTGNFGNILAAFFAKEMGVPIARLLCASNENKVLYDFFSTGSYNKNREFILTSSPSMDILISSNLERLIYKIAREDAKANQELMLSLKENGIYTITEEMKTQLKDFYGNYATEEETEKTIQQLYEKTGYVIDTHTAVAAAVYKKYQEETKDQKKTLVVSTASPYKFTRSVMNSIDKKYSNMEDFELVDELSRISHTAVPKAIEEIRNANVVHDRVCNANQMTEMVQEILGI